MEVEASEKHEEEEAPVPEQAGFGMEGALTEFELAQAKETVEQQAILYSSTPRRR